MVGKDASLSACNYEHDVSANKWIRYITNPGLSNYNYGTKRAQFIGIHERVEKLCMGWNCRILLLEVVKCERTAVEVVELTEKIH